MAGDARAEAQDRSPAPDLSGAEAAPGDADQRAQAGQREADRRERLKRWHAGEVLDAEELAARGVAGGAAAPACYTTARWDGARVWWEARHEARLARDARALGLGEVPAGACVEAMRALGRACFGAHAGIVRVEATRDARGALLVTGSAREVGPEPACWSAVSSARAHPGPSGDAPGAKRAHVGWLGDARSEAGAAGADEALLWDPDGRLVEGTRSNVCVARADGRWVTPPLARGGVAGVARELLLERVPALGEGDASRADLVAARELVACNAVRGARAIVRVDGRRVGDGAPGALARALVEALARTD